MDRVDDSIPFLLMMVLTETDKDELLVGKTLLRNADWDCLILHHLI